MKIAIVVQRYGLNINGGAELHARLLAEKLNKNHTVHVLTTQSESYIVWDNNLSNKHEIINGIEVFRFPSAKKDQNIAHKYFRRMRNLSKISIGLRKIGLKKTAASEKLIFPEIFKQWLRYQGPYCPQMIEHIQKVKNDYDIFIFFSYLYYPSNAGIPIVKEKSIFIPTAHDEKQFYFPGYGLLFKQAAFIMYNSLAEKKLVENTYPYARYTPNDIAGVGMEPKNIQAGKPPSDKNYFVYIGRLDRSKNVPQLTEWFTRYAENKDVKLILIGKADNCHIQTHEKIHMTGFITDKEKDHWLIHSKGLIIPSRHESLSMVTLESMQAGIPVIANAHSEVLADHIRKSGAGFTYKRYEEFEKALDTLLSMNHEKRQALGKKGKAYVKQNYDWKIILDKFEKAFNRIKKRE